MSPVMNDLDPVPRPLDRLTLRGVPDAMALVDRGGGLTYAALEDAVAAAAAWLARQGAMPGDRVATWLPKTRTACVMPLAAVRAGGAATAISRAVAQPFLASASLAVIGLPLPARPFRALRHPDRPEGPAARALLGMVPRA